MLIVLKITHCAQNGSLGSWGSMEIVEAYRVLTRLSGLQRFYWAQNHLSSKGLEGNRRGFTGAQRAHY